MPLHDPRNMLPPPPLGRRPEGLLDVLGIKSGGRYPQHLLQDLQPQIDLTQLYFDPRAEYLKGGNGTVSAVANLVAGTTITVPASEDWLILSAEIASDGQVNPTITLLQFGITADPGSGVWAQNGSVYPLLYTGRRWVTNDVIGDVWEPYPARFVPAGTIMGLYCLAYAGTGGETVFWRLRYVRLPR